MVKISRSFRAVEYAEGVSTTEFQDNEPVAKIHSVVNLDKEKNKMLVAHHEYPADNRDFKSRTWSYHAALSDWGDILELSDVLKRFRSLPDDVALSNEFPVKELEISEMKIYKEDADGVHESRDDTYEDASLSYRLSDSVLEFSPRHGSEPQTFPWIPVGEEYAREGFSSNSIHLNRLIEMIEDIEEGIQPSDSPDPTLDEKTHSLLNSIDYGHEIIQHSQDGDICLEKGLHQLALSSYIHAIEWTIIAYLKTDELDIIEKEKDGTYYNLAGGRNSLLEEVNERAGLDQKTTSQLRSFNRAERRWMAHHKSGEILPEEIEAVRARLRSLVEKLF